MKKRVLLGMMVIIIGFTIPGQVRAYDGEDVIDNEIEISSMDYESDSVEENEETEDIGENDKNDGIDDIDPLMEEHGESTANDEEEAFKVVQTKGATKAVAVSELTISGSTLVAAGKSYQYTVSALPKNASIAVVWEVSSSDQGVSIDSKGKLKIAKDCSLTSCEISATSKENGEIKDTYTVNINPCYIKSMDILEDGKSIVGSTKKNVIFWTSGTTGARTSFTPDVKLTSSNGREFIKRPYKITCDNENIVKVDENGKISATGNGTGTAKIKYIAIDGSKNSEGNTLTKTITVRVENPVTGVSLRIPEDRSKYIVKGKTIKLSALVNSAYGAPMTKEVTYRSSNPAVATVSESGVVTMKAGSYSSVTIIATAKDGSNASGSIDLVGCNAVKNISLGDIPYHKADTSKVTTISLKDGTLELPLKYNDPEGGDAEKMRVCPDIQVTSSNPKCLEVSYKDGVMTLNPLNKYETKNIIIKATVPDGSGLVIKWNFKVSE